MTVVPAVSALRHRPGQAILYSLAAIFCLSAVDALAKWLVADYAVAQIVFLRYLASLAVALAVAGRQGGLGQLRTRRPLAHLFRACLNLASILAFYYALREMALADTVAITFAAPILTTCLSVLLLRERVSGHRWIALALGMAGVMIMLQPSGQGFNAAGLLALASALFYALGLVAARQLSTSESSATILFFYSLGVIVLTGALMPWIWRTPDGDAAVLIVLAGLIGAFGQLFVNQACRYGELSMLAPLEYTALLWATGFGFVIWGDLPGWPVWLGAALVAASSLYMAQAEARRQRRPG